MVYNPPMKFSEILGSYAHSLLGVSAALGSIIAGVLAFFLGKVPLLFSVLISAAIYLVSSAAFLLTKRGAKSVIREQDYLRFLRISEKVQEASDERDRISFLRIADEGIDRAVKYFLLVSGQYLDVCRKEKTYDPVANNAITEVLTIIQAFLTDKDDASVDKRFSLKGETDPKRQEPWLWRQYSDRVR